ncbi:MAG: hypothetical protein V3V08_04850, partial [Nannocystaceae bacterium]
EVISLCGAEVRATSVEIVARGDEAAVTATVEAGHSEQLVKVIHRLARIADVFDVRRIRS